jgi:hypothetical protein
MSAATVALGFHLSVMAELSVCLSVDVRLMQINASVFAVSSQKKTDVSSGGFLIYIYS